MTLHPFTHGLWLIEAVDSVPPESMTDTQDTDLSVLDASPTEGPIQLIRGRHRIHWDLPHEIYLEIPSSGVTMHLVHAPDRNTLLQEGIYRLWRRNILPTDTQDRITFVFPGLNREQSMPLEDQMALQIARNLVQWAGIRSMTEGSDDLTQLRDSFSDIYCYECRPFISHPIPRYIIDYKHLGHSYRRPGQFLYWSALGQVIQVLASLHALRTWPDHHPGLELKQPPIPIPGVPRFVSFRRNWFVSQPHYGKDQPGKWKPIPQHIAEVAATQHCLLEACYGLVHGADPARIHSFRLRRLLSHTSNYQSEQIARTLVALYSGETISVGNREVMSLLKFPIDSANLPVIREVALYEQLPFLYAPDPGTIQLEAAPYQTLQEFRRIHPSATIDHLSYRSTAPTPSP